MEAAYHSALRLDPESQQCSLMEICSLVTKGTTPTSVGYQYQDEGIRFVKVESLVDGHIDQSKCAYISDAAHANLARSQMQAGDVLVSIAGTLGRVGIVSKQDVPANTNQALAIVRLNDPRLAPYVKAFLELPSTQYQLRSGGKGVGMSNLTLQQIREIQIAIPRTEVRRSWLDAVDATKETFRRIALCLATNRMKAQQLRAAILRSAYSGTLVPQYSSDEPASDLLRRIAADRATSAEQVPKRIRHTHTTVPETTSG
jgi:type I restriction enzyme S subunit